MSANNNSIWKRLIPYLIVFGIFLVLAAIFNMPFLQGMKLLPHDVEQFLFMSTEIRDFYAKTGSNAHWTNNMFSGMPSTMIEFYSNANWFQKLKYIIFGMKESNFVNPIAYFFWAMVGFFVLSRSLKINKWLGVIGAIAFAFSTYNPIILGAGHLTKFIDLAFLPMIIGGIIYTYRGKYWLGVALTAISLAIFVDAGHYQIMIYAAFVIVAIVIGYGISLFKKGLGKQFLIATGLLLVVALVGAGTSATRLMITQEYNEYSMRGGNTELRTDDATKGLDKDYAFKWSNGIGETFTIIVPNLYGGSSAYDVGKSSAFGEELSKFNAAQYAENAPLYWGPQQSDGISGSIYFGAIIVFLTILSLFVIRSNKKWWFFGAALLMIAISWGKNFPLLNYMLFDSFPLFNKLRSPNMALSLASLLFPVLAIWGLQDFFSGKYPKEVLMKKLKVGGFTALGVMLLILITVLVVFDYRGPADTEISKGFGNAANSLLSALRDDRKSFATKDAFRSLVLMLAAFGVLWFFIKGRLNQKTSIIILGVVIAFDIMSVANRYLNEKKYIDADEYEERFAARPVDLQIKKDPDVHYRVLDLSRDLFNSATSSGQHHTIGGYSPAKLQIYQDLIASHIGTLNSAVLNMLNTKYLIPQAQQGAPLQAVPNPAALGNAWFISNVKTVNTAREEMDALKAPSLSNPNDTAGPGFNPKETVILRNTEASALSGKNSFIVDANANIKLTEYNPNRMKYESNNTQDGFAVFSEIYYPKWKAFIDGKEAKIIRANYALRGIHIPAGKHVVEMKIDTSTFDKGERLARISTILLILIIGGSLFFHFRNVFKNNDEKVEEVMNKKNAIATPHETSTAKIQTKNTKKKK